MVDYFDAISNSKTSLQNRSNRQWFMWWFLLMISQNLHVFFKDGNTKQMMKSVVVHLMVCLDDISNSKTSLQNRSNLWWFLWWFHVDDIATLRISPYWYISSLDYLLNWLLGWNGKFVYSYIANAVITIASQAQPLYSLMMNMQVFSNCGKF